MKIAITGSDGFIGTHLKKFFADHKFEVIPIVRADFASEPVTLKNKLLGCDVVINLAGANISKRWTRTYKQVIYSSRIDTTHKLVTVINALTEKPKLLISTSAVGYYPSGGPYTEKNASPGNDFLAHVCADWEKEAEKVNSSVRLVISRFGVVFSSDGGAFPMMIMPFKTGIGVTIGSGNGHLSWIHINDLMAAMLYVIEHDSIIGPINFTAPETVTIKRFNRLVAKKLNAYCCVKIPEFTARVVFGEGYSFMIADKQIIPEELPGHGYQFRYPKIDVALKELLRK